MFCEDRMASSSKRFKVVHSEGRNIIKNVILFCDEEAASNQYKYPVKQATKRVAALAGTSESTVKRIRREIVMLKDTEETKLLSPGKKRKNSLSRQTTDKIDDFDRCVIRRTINDFYCNEKKVPSVNKILPILKEKIDFSFSKTSLRKILKELGFKWKSTQSNRKILMEKDYVKLHRTKYLRAIKQYREMGKNIIYTDETWVDSNITFGKCWQSDDISGLIKTGHPGKRLIVVSAGGKYGFVPNSTLIYKADAKTGDYHGQMNAAIFEKWVRNYLMPNLHQNSVIILDNAPYHNVQVNKQPTSSSLKKDIIEWLVKNNVSFRDNMRKYELLEIVKSQNHQKIFFIDSILEQNGHTVLRLPPYHCDLNAIELIWAQLKQQIREQNIQDDNNLQKLTQITNSAFETINSDKWKNCCEHVVKVEDNYWEIDGIVDETSERLLISLTESSASSSEEIDQSSSDSE